MRKEKKPFQEKGGKKKKKIQSRSQSYCAFWTKGTMCLDRHGELLQQH